jgi:hypothetical protein
MKAEGWYTDPYACHEARWLSDGVATKLVRDGDATSYDEPPEGPFVREPEAIEPDPVRAGADDLRRADEAESGPAVLDLDDAWMKTMDVVWSDGAPLEVLGHDVGDSPHKHRGHKDGRR